ncbi:Bifunctional 3-dehydroquinate dehydratase/shikimate dehydrogenase, chloroplastic [Glycine soja]
MSIQAIERGRERERERERERMVREVSESCIDSLLTEMVACYCNRFYANKPELAARRIEAIGYQVGHQLSERYTMDRPRFTDHLEAIKFICKDFWSELFKKQIDNLKTNHRGTFVLQDNKFRWLARMSIDPSTENVSPVEDITSPTAESKAAQAMSMHLYFPCGIIRGALSNLGIPCAVSADISNLPACSFVVRADSMEYDNIELLDCGKTENSNHCNIVALMERRQTIRGRGRPKKTIREVIKKDLELNDLDRSMFCSLGFKLVLMLIFWTVSVNQMGSNQVWKHSVMVCAAITTHQYVSAEQIVNGMHQAKAEGADIVELRLDCITNFHSHHDLKIILQNKPLPVLIVNRPKWEGGLYEGDENKRLEALQLAVELSADFIDVELKVPLIAYSVGERGLISQLLSPKFGGLFVYGSLAGNPIPGLPSLDSIQEAYKLEHVNADTKVFGLISKPVSHSRGPILHNPSFKDVNYNGIYVPMFVDDLKKFFSTYPSPDFSGFSVGIPYKEEVLRFCDEVHPLAQSIGAVNTIIRRPRDGKLVGYNTDCEAAITAIEDALIEHGCNDGEASLGSPLAGRLFVLVGAGGAGKALAFGAKSRGARLVIFDIDFDKAKSLACAVFGEAQPFKELVNFQPEKGAILANATPVGMHPNTDRIPVAEATLEDYRLVFDAVYTPRRTRLLNEADAAGAITVGGVEMFLRQAIGQFNLFTGLEGAAFIN